MAKKQYFLVVDTETTQSGLVADFAAVLCDKKGRIVSQCAVLVNGIYTDSANHPLFFTSDPNGIWSKKGQDKRYGTYARMLESGARMLASVASINLWLEKAKKHNPILTAYNLPFDLDKCRKTGIDLTGFDSFDLWAASVAKWCHTKKYKQFALESHAFNPPTDKGNMTYKTNAEVMARFVLGWPEMPPEPHTALEDVVDYEIPVLVALLRDKKLTRARILEGFQPYNWRGFQVRDNFKAK